MMHSPELSSQERMLFSFVPRVDLGGDPLHVRDLGCTFPDGNFFIVDVVSTKVSDVV